MSNTLEETLYAPGNGTDVHSSSTPGLVVGLTLFFLTLVIVAGVIVYKYFSKCRNMLQCPQRSSQKKEHYSETTQDDSHQYTSMYRDQSTGQTPIYENVARNTGYRRPEVNQRRLHGEPEEDLYLQCDISDDAIYSNNPKCNLAVLPVQEEDVYLMPDS